MQNQKQCRNATCVGPLSTHGPRWWHRHAFAADVQTPSPEGKQNLADGTLGCISNEHLYQLAVNIDLGFLRPVKVAGEKRPPSTHFLPVYDDDSFEEQLTLNAIDDPSLWEQLRLRKDCFHRDGDICVVSKIFTAVCPITRLFIPA